MTRKNIVLSIQTVLFFGFMTAGTFFGSQIGDAFRPAVAVIHPEYCQVEYTVIAAIEGAEVETTVRKNSILIPFEALDYDSEGYYVYLLQEQTEAFGSYYILCRHPVTVEMIENYVMAVSGLSSVDWIVSDIEASRVEGELETGRRIVPIYLPAP